MSSSETIARKNTFSPWTPYEPLEVAVTSSIGAGMAAYLSIDPVTAAVAIAASTALHKVGFYYLQKLMPFSRVSGSYLYTFATRIPLVALNLTALYAGSQIAAAYTGIKVGIVSLYFLHSIASGFGGAIAQHTRVAIESINQ